MPIDWGEIYSGKSSAPATTPTPTAPASSVSPAKTSGGIDWGSVYKSAPTPTIANTPVQTLADKAGPIPQPGPVKGFFQSIGDVFSPSNLKTTGQQIAGDIPQVLGDTTKGVYDMFAKPSDTEKSIESKLNIGNNPTSPITNFISKGLARFISPVTNTLIDVPKQATQSISDQAYNVNVTDRNLANKLAQTAQQSTPEVENNPKSFFDQIKNNQQQLDSLKTTIDKTPKTAKNYNTLIDQYNSQVGAYQSQLKAFQGYKAKADLVGRIQNYQESAPLPFVGLSKKDFTAALNLGAVIGTPFEIIKNLAGSAGDLLINEKKTVTISPEQMKTKLANGEITNPKAQAIAQHLVDNNQSLKVTGVTNRGGTIQTIGEKLGGEDLSGVVEHQVLDNKGAPAIKGFVPPTESPLSLMAKAGGTPKPFILSVAMTPVEMAQGGQVQTTAPVISQRQMDLYGGKGVIQAGLEMFGKPSEGLGQSLASKAGDNLYNVAGLAQASTDIKVRRDARAVLQILSPSVEDGYKIQKLTNLNNKLESNTPETKLIQEAIQNMLPKPLGFQPPTASPVEMVTQAAKAKLQPTTAKPGTQTVAEAQNLNLQKTVKPSEKLTPTEEGVVRTDTSTYRRPPIGKTELKTLISSNSEFKTNPVLTVNAAGNLEFKGKSAQFEIKPDAMQLKAENLKPGDKVTVDKAALQEKGAPQQLRVTKSDGTVLAMKIPFVTEFIEQDVKPGTIAFAKGAVQIFKDAVNLVAPRMGASPKSVDAFMKMKGERDKTEFVMQRTLKTSEKMFDSLPVEEQIAFVDRYKTGEKQPTKELQAYADFRRAYDKQIFDQIEAVKPTISWKEDHLRVLWKKVPGSTATAREQIFGSKRPLQGSGGFLKQSTLPDMSTGIEMGGVPVTYNPAKMDNLAWADSIRYISAHKMWKTLKETGSRQYLAAGKPIPEGKALVNDRIANMMGGGRWVLDEGDARLLNNMLSVDYIRKAAAGRAAFVIKNGYTAVELSLSTFHGIFVSLDTMSSQLSLGLLKMFNLGVKQGIAGIVHADPSEIKAGIKAFASGVKDVVTTPFSPITNARLGKAAATSLTGKPDIVHGKDLETAKAEFKKSNLGKMLYKQYENYPELVDLLFNGGLKPKMDSAYRASTVDTMKENIYTGNYIGGMLRGIPALNQTIMTPLFEWYIPSLKWGVSLKALAYELDINANRIADGKISKEEIARNVVNRTENRLGEMNFSNLFWNNTFKSGMQLAFRSITWTGGYIRELAGAPYEQAREFYHAYKEKRSPNMTPKMAYVFALYILTAILAEIIQYLSTGEHINPFSKDVAYPKIDDQGNRVAVPTYIKDIFAAKQKPMEFARNKLSGAWGKVVEGIQNKDFYSNEVYRESDPAWLKFTKAMWHLKPMPFSVQSAMNQPTKGEKIQSFVGITKAPRYVENTPIQNDIYDLYGKRFGGGTKSELQTQKADTSKQYKAALAAGDTKKAEDIKAQAITDGIYTERGFGRINTNLKTGTDKVLFDRLPQDDKDTLTKKMTPEEKAFYTASSSSGGRGGRGGSRSGGRSSAR